MARFKVSWISSTTGTSLLSGVPLERDLVAQTQRLSKFESVQSQSPFTTHLNYVPLVYLCMTVFHKESTNKVMVAFIGNNVSLRRACFISSWHADIMADLPQGIICIAFSVTMTDELCIAVVGGASALSRRCAHLAWSMLVSFWRWPWDCPGVGQDLCDSFKSQEWWFLLMMATWREDVVVPILAGANS